MHQASLPSHRERFGPDCYRTWEALLVGTIPIVKRGQYGISECAKQYLGIKSGMLQLNRAIHAQLDKLYEQLPIVVVDEWDEITEEFLEKKHAEISSKKYNLKLLHIDYWKTLIKTIKKDYIKNYTQKL